jgi:hypothetical protein
MLWFRVYNEMRNDTKLRLIATALGTEEAFVHGMWVDVLCLAAELDQDWHLRVDEGHPLSFEQVSAEVKVKRDTGGVTGETFLAAAVEYGLVEEAANGLVIASGKRRNAKPSDSRSAVSERVRRHREAKKTVQTGDEVKRVSQDDVTRSVTPQEVEVEVDQELPPITPPDPFDDVFWPSWPNRHGSKQLSKSRFRSLTAPQQQRCLAAEQHLIEAISRGALSIEYQPRAENFIGGSKQYYREWADGPPPKYASAGSAAAQNSYQQPLDDYDRGFLTSTIDEVTP